MNSIAERRARKKSTFRSAFAGQFGKSATRNAALNRRGAVRRGSMSGG
ncbi:hypothetical protein [Deinococcus sp. Marseille-Q6407]|nr:hypothetical protein [Deinococcus sp. Marseille-Q6407]